MILISDEINVASLAFTTLLCCINLCLMLHHPNQNSSGQSLPHPSAWNRGHWSLVTLFTVSTFWSKKDRVTSDQVCLESHTCHTKMVRPPLWSPVTLFVPEVSFLKEVSQKSLVFEFRSFIFEGSLAEKLRLRASKLHGFYLSIYLSTYWSIYLSYLILSYLSIFLIYLSLSIYISLALSISLSLYLSISSGQLAGGGSLNEEVEWRQWFSGTQGGEVSIKK